MDNDSIFLGALVLDNHYNHYNYYNYYSTLRLQINCTGSEKTWLECQQISSNCINSISAEIACQPLQSKYKNAECLYYCKFY